MVDLQAYDLRVESRTEPLGIDEFRPRFSWRLSSATAGDAQSGYRILVQDDGDTIVWDSGWVESTRCYEVVCGVDLQARTRYSWSLQLRDLAGGVTTSGTSWFETGLGRAAGWGGNWIGRNRFADNRAAGFDPPDDEDVHGVVRDIPPASYLRRQVPGVAPATRARLYVTARGIYRAFLNGERVGRDELTPGWTDYRDRVLYQTYDVTEQLRQGDNTLGLVLADGWWSGYVGFDRRRQGNHYGTQPMAWALLVVEHADGTTTTVRTDDQWRESAGAIGYTDLLMGEYVDQRNDLGAWAEPGYDDGDWNTAAVLDTDLSTIVAQVDEPVRVVETVQALSRFTDPEGHLVYDFGQNLVGRVQIDLGDLSAGSRVLLRHGEILDGDRLYTDNLRSAAAEDVVVAAGGHCRFEPTFTFHGFRYVEVRTPGEPPELDAVRAVALHNDFARAGTVTTSNPAVNQLISNVGWSLRGNHVALPTDCPQRDERMGWLADAQVFLPTAAYYADMQSMYSRWLRDVRYAQSAEGSFADVAPMVTLFFADGAPAWADGGITMPWHLYRVYGDERLLRESLPSMKRHVDFVARTNPDLLWSRRVGNNYGDWLQVDAETPRDVLATAYFAHSADLVARACEVVEPASAQKYRDLARYIRAAFQTAYVAPDGVIEGDTQTVYLLALAFDLVPSGAKPVMAEHLVRTIERADRRLTTGFVGVALLCPILSDIGRDDLAFALLESERYPSWLYSVKHGATTIWERWDGWTDHGGFQSVNMNSFNHYSLGSVVEWLYRYAAGIDQAEGSVGFERLHYQPRVGGTFTHVEADYTSVRGQIHSAWRRGDGVIEFELDLPPGTSADIHLPLGRSLTVNGAAQEQAPFTVRSGRHRMILVE